MIVNFSRTILFSDYLFPGILTVLLTFLLEIVSGRWTTLFGMGIEFFWVLGWLTLGLFSRWLPQWRRLVLVTSMPGLPVAAVLLFLMPESPRWLLTVGRRKEAERVVRRAAKGMYRCCHLM